MASAITFLSSVIRSIMKFSVPRNRQATANGPWSALPMIKTWSPIISFRQRVASNQWQIRPDFKRSGMGVSYTSRRSFQNGSCSSTMAGSSSLKITFAPMASAIVASSKSMTQPSYPYFSCDMACAFAIFLPLKFTSFIFMPAVSVANRNACGTTGI
ncbi:hypothetical protein SDC9_190229 [bioreactor metagenome]|uniref:Uncharacterized protein n=1 Tax=bioreactor metagenome TaxID=1076179 RepID=A0A645HW29_9ZZZZ